jgi:hypothetical protein
VTLLRGVKEVPSNGTRFLGGDHDRSADADLRNSVGKVMGALAMTPKNRQLFDANYIVAICELCIEETERVMDFINKHAELFPKEDEVFEALNQICCKLEVARQVAALAFMEPSPQLEMVI